MKHLILMTLVMGVFGMGVQADLIRKPKKPKGIVTLTYANQAAEDLWKSLNVKEVKAAALGGVTVTKTLRARDGSFQLVCTQRRTPKRRGRVIAVLLTTCTMKVSTSGKTVKVKRQPRRLG